MTETFAINKLEDIGSVVGRLMKLTPPYTVTVSEGEEPRRARQNRFAFEVYKQVAKLKGDLTPSEARAISKLHVGIPLLREESETFREKYDRIVRQNDYETKLELMVEPIELPVTSLMTVKQMSEYITRLLAYWDPNGAAGIMLERFDL